MQIGSVNQAAATPPPSDAGKAYLDYEAFLRLLVAEMKNQDPTSPADATQYMAQLASFSSVEQGIKTNTKLDQLMTSMALTQADSLIGRTATSADGMVTGTIAAIEIAKTGSTAILEDGRRMTLQDGVRIS